MAKYADWSEELEQALAEPFPQDWVKHKKTGGASVSFVPWHRYVSKLNQLVGKGWSMGTPLTMHVGDKLVMGVPVTIFGVTRINWGDEDDSEWETVVDKKTGEEEEKKTMYGSPATNAFAQAFKRTCALFGMGLDMYEKGEAGSGASGQRRQPAAAPASASPVPACPKCGGTMWDNRPKKASGTFKPNSPDFACKDKTCKHAVWEPDEKATATNAVLLQDKLNRALGLDAVSFHQAEMIEGAINVGDSDKIKQALVWLDQQMEKKKLARETPNIA